MKKEEEEEVEGEALTPAAKKRTPLAIHQSRPGRFFRRNNHRADSYRSLHACLPACLVFLLSLVPFAYAVVMRCGPERLLSLGPLLRHRKLLRE